MEKSDKTTAIVLSGEVYELVKPNIESCDNCDLDKFCDKFKEPLCDMLAGEDNGMVFKKSTKKIRGKEGGISTNSKPFALGDKIRNNSRNIEAFVIGLAYEYGWITARSTLPNTPPFPITADNFCHWEKIIPIPIFCEGHTVRITDGLGRKYTKTIEKVLKDRYVFTDGKQYNFNSQDTWELVTKDELGQSKAIKKSDQDKLTAFEEQLLAVCLCFPANTEEDKISFIREAASDIFSIARKNIYDEITEEELQEAASRYRGKRRDGFFSGAGFVLSKINKE